MGIKKFLYCTEKCLFHCNHWRSILWQYRLEFTYVLSWLSSVIWWYSWAVLWPKRAIQGGKRLLSNQSLTIQGDFVDSGFYMVEIFFLLLALKAAVLSLFCSASLVSSYVLINVAVKVLLWIFLCNLRGLFFLSLSWTTLHSWVLQ